MSNLLTLNFWFNFYPPALSPLFVKIFLGIIALFLFLAIVFKLLQAKKKGLYSFLYRKLVNFFFTNFAIGAVLLFFSYEAIPYLSTRFFLIVWFIGVAVWLYFILIRIKDVPKRKEQLDQAKEYQKYIP